MLVELLPFYVELCMGFSNCDVYLMLKELFLRNIIAQQRLQLCDLTGLCLNLVVQVANFFLKEILIVVYFTQAICVKVNCLINFFPLLLSGQTFKNFYLKHSIILLNLQVRTFLLLQQPMMKHPDFLLQSSNKCIFVFNNAFIENRNWLFLALRD